MGCVNGKKVKQPEEAPPVAAPPRAGDAPTPAANEQEKATPVQKPAKVEQQDVTGEDEASRPPPLKSPPPKALPKHSQSLRQSSSNVGQINEAKKSGELEPAEPGKDPAEKKEAAEGAAKSSAGE